MKTVVCPVYRITQRYPDDIALIENNLTLSYGDLNAQIETIQDSIKRLSLKKGSRIALLSHTNHVMITLLFALWREKIVTTLLSPRLPEKIIPGYCRDTGSSVLITEPSFPIADSARSPILDFAFCAPTTKDSSLTILYLSNLISPEKNCSSEQEPCYTQNQDLCDILLSPQKTYRAEQKPFFNLSQDLSILYTSGSTAQPKAVVHTFGNHFYNALGSNRHIPLNRHDRWLLALPLYHVSGISILFRCFLSGATVVIQSSHRDVSREIREKGITHVSLVPTQLYRLLERKTELTPNALKCMLIGGCPAPDTLVCEAIKNKLPIYLSYGLTEMASQVATTPLLNDSSYTTYKNKAQILNYREVTIDSSQEILVRGETLFKGYSNQGQLERPFDKDGWYHTGDLGELTEEHCLIVTGRKDNMFISGGENIQPEEIEGCLSEIEGIERAIVFPVSCKEFGQRPAALLKLSPHHTLHKEGITQLLKRRLPSYKIPTSFYIWPEGIYTSTEKIKRSAMAKKITTMQLVTF